MPAIDGAIVVFAKVPNPGTSKTRLAPLLGDEGAAFLAQAMLSDILVSLSQCVSSGSVSVSGSGSGSGSGHGSGSQQNLCKIFVFS